VFENRALRRKFGPRRDEVIWEWRKLYNEELNGLYSSPNKIYRVLVGKPEGKSPLGRTRRRWDDNINLDLQKVRSGLDRSGSG
jgi:hypothetical protein